MLEAPTDRLFVQCRWDEDAGVWYVAESNVPGLSVEADTQRSMTAKLRRVIPELLRLNEPALSEGSVPFELLYSRIERAKLDGSRR